MSASTLSLKPLIRVFQHGSLELPDPNPKLKPDEVRKILGTQFPELLNAGIEGPTIRGNKQVFTFNKTLGTKG